MSRRFIYTSSQYLTINQAPVTAAGFSVSCWYRPIAFSANQTLISIGDVDVTNEQWRLSVNTLGRVRWSAQTSAGEAFATYSTSVLAAGLWGHCGGAEVSATSRLAYFNGGSATNTTSRAPAGADTLRVGAIARSSPSDFAHGDIAEVALWDVVLTAAEFARLADGAHPSKIRPERLIFWPLGGGDTADFRGRLPLIPVASPAVSGPPPLKRRVWLPVWKAPTGGTIQEGAAALVGTAHVAPMGQAIAQGAAGLVGEGVTLPAGQVIAQGQAQVTGVADVLPVGQLIAQGAVGLEGIAEVTAVGTVSGGTIHEAAAVLIGSGDMAPVGQMVAQGTAVLTGAAELTPTAQKVTQAGVGLVGEGNTFVAGQLIAQGATAVVGLGRVTANGQAILQSAAHMVGVGVLLADGGFVTIGDPYPLTLRARDNLLSVEDRGNTLTLRNRSNLLTVEDRP